ncbi:MAG: prolyl oligopeptidase family serine peptidase, partial [Gemmatimonadetes bacterium]|nr:prolyl oligopeptidase family serine peptidase [Gemmatimonadota bacterium]
RYPPQGEREADGVDVVVRDLADGTDLSLGNVSEYAWRDGGALLAMIVDAEGRAGNGVRVFDPASGHMRTLDARPTRYAGLAWREDADDLAVLRAIEGETEAAWGDTAWVVLAFRDVEPAGRGGASALVLDPATTASFPGGQRVVPWEDLRGSEDGAILFLGLQERSPKEACAKGGEDDAKAAAAADPAPDETDPPVPPEGTAAGDPACDDDDDAPTVEVWHAGDVDIVPTQKVRADRLRRENDLAAWHVAEGRLVRLEDELTEDVRLIDGAAHAVGLDGTPYDPDRMFGPVYRDVYVVELATGEKRRVLERIERVFDPSPGGTHLLFLEDDHYRTVDLASGETTCITCGLPTSFVDLEDDHTVEQKPPFGVAGWLEDGRGALLYDRHDVWRVAPDGSGATRLTAGAASNVRHRRLRLDEDEEAIDPSRPQYFSLYDDWTETWGFARSDALGGDLETLIEGEARYGRLQKAADADVYAYVVEDFEDSPDVFVGGAGLADARQVTRTNPFQDEYLWGRAELVAYTNEWGDTLQGALYYPAGWEPGRRYPMITYIYEIRSNAVRSYGVPSERDYYNLQSWVQDGYFVFQPDIVYRDRDPGVSAVVNIEPAVEAVLATGMVDPDRIGLVGHSWGGYQTTFFVTQSDLFAAAVAGAPLTNLFSMYLSVYWNSGGTDARIFEISQGRMEVPFWEDEDAYRRNSPVFHIENMRTPLLMAQGTEDGAVDFNQGVEFYNAARRAGKDFVFLVYNDENHGLRQEANQRDYHQRIRQWFGHYLKGEPAPAWIEAGVPYLEQPGGRKGR